MNLRLVNCDKVIGRYWRVAMYKCLGVFLKESKDIVIYHDGGYWWVARSRARSVWAKELLELQTGSAAATWLM